MSDKNKLFGTDGIRGIANQYPMTSEVAIRVGRAVAQYFRGRAERVDQKSLVIIGKDTRRSSYMLELALASGLTSQGVNVLLLGPMPTPGVSFLTKSMRADAGMMVSASHNSFEYNGIKIFGHDGFKLPDEVEAQIEKLALSAANDMALPTGADLGRAKRIDDVMGRYIVTVKNSLSDDAELKGVRVVLDCANGAAYKCAPMVFEELGAEVILLANQPDGTNINLECGAVNPEAMRENLIKYRANIGVALDGDADRVILCDENGKIVDGDALMYLIACNLKKMNALDGNKIVVTPMSNLGLERALEKKGIGVLYADIGDRAVVECMRANKLILGGEQSGHVVFLKHSSTGDGTMAALQVMNIMACEKLPLSELVKDLKTFPQVLKNFTVTRKVPLEELESAAAFIDSAEKDLGRDGRILVRYSGTEPLCRVMVEGKDALHIDAMAQKIVDHLKDDIQKRT